MSDTGHIEHNGTIYEIPKGSSAKKTYESLKQVLPEFVNSKLKPKGKNWIVETDLPDLG